MLPRCPRLLYLKTLVVLAAVLTLVPAAQAQGAAAPPAPTLVVQGLGKATVTLGGPWQFHLGDDMQWAQPGVDDATGRDGWETIRADRRWGEQTHFAYAGFAWYRRHIDFVAVAGAPPDLALLIFPTEGPYEAYWNGRLIGQVGRMPPHPAWGLRPPSHSFGLGRERSGVLAIRMWKEPLQFSDSGLGGGLGPAPLAGSGEAIAAYLGDQDHIWLRDKQFYFDENLLYGLLAMLGLWAWLTNRNRKLLLWVSLFALMQPVHVLLFNAHIPFTFQLALELDHLTGRFEGVSLWFLLLYLLELDSNASLRRWTRILATITMIVVFLDCFAIAQDWSGAHAQIFQVVDALLYYPVSLADAYPVVLIVFALRKRLPLASWLVAITASVYEMIGVVAISSIQGVRFTHWATVYYALRYRLFTLNGNYFDPANIASTLLLASIAYAVYRYTVDQTERQGVLEQEFRNARELQQVLIPESLPEIPGFTLTSAYRPAQEVGGDFFQIIPLEGGSTLIILGDVSGKGLKAAMAVSLIVGAARMMAEFTESPAEVLAGLNRRLYGRLQGGFATCVVMRLDADGDCAIACAGHPAPILNDRELDLPGTLPLGVISTAAYQEAAFSLLVGDQLALYTDGLLEARSETGELYGFSRLQELFSARPNAAEATQAAVNFGQEDDITVLTLTRLATGTEATALHSIAEPVS